MHNKLNYLKNKKILILGFGREGKSSLKFLRKNFPNKKIAIADERDDDFLADVDSILDNKSILNFGKDYLSNLSDYDLIFKSPGISSYKKELQRVKNKITSQTELFLKLAGDKTIGITGTKGKSTTSSLIHHILKHSNRHSVLIGNIGKPCLDFIDEYFEGTLFVFEMSSFQLEGITESPHVGVFLNFFREHQDYHGSVKDYFDAKSNITRYQKNNDHFVYNSEFNKLKNLAKQTKAKTYSFSIKNDNDYAYLSGNKIVLNDSERSVISNPQLTKPYGNHNLYNKIAASVVTNLFGISENEIEASLRSFEPLKDRMEVVSEIDGVLYINDSLATIPEATLAAINTFPENPKIVIIGGKDRGQIFDNLVNEIETNESIRTVILIGETAERVGKRIKKSKFKGEVVNLGVSHMNDVVERAASLSKKGGVVLLSPAAASFDMFENYEDRGNKFKEAVKKLQNVKIK